MTETNATSTSVAQPLTAFKMHDCLVNGTCTNSNFHGILLFFGSVSIYLGPTKHQQQQQRDAANQPRVYLFRKMEYYYICKMYMHMWWVGRFMCMCCILHSTWALYFHKLQPFYMYHMDIYRFPFIMQFGLKFVFFPSQNEATICSAIAIPSCDGNERNIACAH